MARRSFRVSVDGEVFNVEVEEINNKGPVLQDNMSVNRENRKRLNRCQREQKICSRIPLMMT